MRVVIAEDAALLREGLTRLLQDRGMCSTKKRAHTDFRVR